LTSKFLSFKIFRYEIIPVCFRWLLWIYFDGFFAERFPEKISIANDPCRTRHCDRIAEGTFTLTNTLSLEGKKKITIRGKGMDKTILSFKEQNRWCRGHQGKRRR
jgi:hypothetical protein